MKVGLDTSKHLKMSIWADLYRICLEEGEDKGNSKGHESVNEFLNTCCRYLLYELRLRPYLMEIYILNYPSVYPSTVLYQCYMFYIRVKATTCPFILHNRFLDQKLREIRSVQRSGGCTTASS